MKVKGKLVKFKWHTDQGSEVVVSFADATTARLNQFARQLTDQGIQFERTEEEE